MQEPGISESASRHAGRPGAPYAEKLSPHEQCATAFGFVTLNPPFCRLSLKSSSEPLTKSALFGSTTTRTPSESTMMSRFAGPSTRSILYCKPEQPPPMTATRSAPSGRPCRVSSEVSFAEAAGVTFTSFSLPILYLISAVWVIGELLILVLVFCGTELRREQPRHQAANSKAPA